MEIIRVPLRLVLNTGGWVWTFFDRLNHTVISFFVKTEYVKKGSCEMTGQCCQAIGVELPGWLLRRPFLVRCMAAWHDLRYNFEFQGIQDHILVYSCRYLTQDNRCGIQRHKPRLCREFPVTNWRGKTKLHKGCGYYFAKRSGIDFDTTLGEAREKNRKIRDQITKGYPVALPDDSQHEPRQKDNLTID